MTEPRSAGYVAPEAVEATPSFHPDALPITTAFVDGIPLDVFKYFDLDVRGMSMDEKTDIKDISSWALRQGRTLGDSLQQLRLLENRLGSPALGERRYSKMLNWIRINNNIDELRKRQEALSDDIWKHQR